MISASLVSRISTSSWFRADWAPFLLLDDELRIRAVNAAYEKATDHPQERLRDAFIFDAFPDNPADPAADGVANLSRSLRIVERTGRRHWMGFQRYDVRDPEKPGSFRFKVWSPVNTPVKENGRVVAVLHHVQDVTPALAGTGDEPRAAGEDLDRTVEALQRQFPDVPAETIIGFVTHSQRVVLGILGAPDASRTTELTRLRLEVHTGRFAQLGPDRET